jgi:hypothetical protein
MAAGDVVVVDKEVTVLAEAFEVFGAEDEQVYFSFLHAIDEASSFGLMQGDAANAFRAFVLQAHRLTASFINGSHGIYVRLEGFKTDIEAADIPID